MEVLRSIEAMRTLGAVLVAALAACGGAAGIATGAAPTPASRAPAPRWLPIDVAVQAERFGESVRLDVEGIGRGVTEGDPFEDPQRWSISARAGRTELARLVNGPVRIARNPVGGAYSEQWDTVVRFSVVYRVPAGASKIAVRLVPPRARPVEHVLTL